jgi:hypothetical protein
VDLVLRVLFYVTNAQRQNIMNSPKLVKLMVKLRDLAKRRVKEQLDAVGYNLQAVGFLRKELRHLKEDSALF